MFFYRGNEMMAVRYGLYKAHYWTWSNSWEEFHVSCTLMCLISTSRLRSRINGDRFPKHCTANGHKLLEGLARQSVGFQLLKSPFLDFLVILKTLTDFRKMVETGPRLFLKKGKVTLLKTSFAEKPSRQRSPIFVIKIKQIFLLCEPMFGFWLL